MYIFKIGDKVYYKNNTRSWYNHLIEKDHPYEIKNIVSNQIFIKVNSYSVIAVNPKDFISEDEYKSIDKNNKNKFEVGDTVYYNGNDNIMRKNVPTRLFRSISGDGFDIFIKGDRLTFSADYINKNFISNDEYLNINGLDKNELHNGGTDVEIKLRIFKDTKDKKLKWFRPYRTHENHYRTIINLDNPKNAYLRIDLFENNDDKYTLTINYHRNSIHYKANQNSISIKKYDESKTIKMILKYVEEQVNYLDDVY